MKAIYPISASERVSGLSQAALRHCAQLFNQQGVLLLKGVMTVSEVESLLASYLARFGSWDLKQLLQISYPVGHRRLLQPLLLEGAFAQAQFYANALLYPLLQNLLGQRMVLNNASLVTALAGAQEQRLHRDTAPLFGNNPIFAHAPSYGITLVIPLVELNDQTGTTRLMPGSHHDTRSAKHYQGHPGFYPTCQLGDIYLMDFRLVHGGTANLSAYSRPIVYMSYTRNWYTDLENTIEMDMPALVMSDANLKQVPEEYRSLLVYAKTMPRQLNPHWQQLLDQSPIQSETDLAESSES